MKEFAYTTHIQPFPDDDSAVKVEIHYHYIPGHPAVMYLSNGDPGYPEEPADVEIFAVAIADNYGMIVSDDQLNAAVDNWYEGEGYDLLIQHAERLREPDPDDLRDERKDRDHE